MVIKSRLVRSRLHGCGEALAEADADADADADAVPVADAVPEDGLPVLALALAVADAVPEFVPVSDGD